MRYKFFLKAGLLQRVLRLFILAVLAMLEIQHTAYAHQTPNTIVLLDINPNSVYAELQLPLNELELAFGHAVTKNTETLVQRLGPQLKEYLLAHIHPMVAKDKPWLVAFTDMEVQPSQQTASGPFQEIMVHLVLTPPPGAGTRKFILDYDVIMHQVVTHSALVYVRNDWESGNTGGQTAEMGVVRVNTRTTLIYPLEVNLEKGSWWKGFTGMVSLGRQHIAEGTDHLLFLLVLLLPSMLLVKGKQWGNFGGVKYSIPHLLKIVTAFTFGHSITLLIAALGWLRMPAQPVEIMIAVSILISAAHAIRPVFPGREMYVAAGFGLVHGLAFASVLAHLNLDRGPMALSILGFNIGIELMQLFVISVTVPWLILLSCTPFYKLVRVTGAVLAAIVAVAWIAERISGQANAVTGTIQNIASYGKGLIIALATLSLIAFSRQYQKIKGNLLAKKLIW